MAKKQKQPTKTCADCIHESACRVWTDGRAISDAAASQCPNHETVKESGAYLCGVLDERERKRTNADRIRAMNDKELADFLSNWGGCNKCKFRDTCTSSIGRVSEICKEIHFEWLKQTAG